ncbi:MAG: STAS domain-containing protein [Oscillospiraceae bacterium]|nr:STAS domain-containing protein [Oscillospiraceae bacterium]
MKEFTEVKFKRELTSGFIPLESLTDFVELFIARKGMFIIMRITESRGSRTTTLFVVGKIDDAAGPQLQNEIFRAAKLTKNVTLDFNDADSISEESVKALQTCNRLITSKRGVFLIQNAPPKVRRDLQKGNLGSLLMH